MNDEKKLYIDVYITHTFVNFKMNFELTINEVVWAITKYLLYVR